MRKCKEPLAGDIVQRKNDIERRNNDIMQREQGSTADKQQKIKGLMTKSEEQQHSAKKQWPGNKEQRQMTMFKERRQQAKRRHCAKNRDVSTDELISPFLSSKKKSSRTFFDKDTPTWSKDKEDNKKGAPNCGADAGNTE